MYEHWRLTSGVIYQLPGSLVVCQSYDSLKWRLDLLDLTLDCGVSPRPHLNSRLASSNIFDVLHL